jgi:3-dehydroquinate synthetase
MAEPITVSTPDGCYSIIIEPGLLQQADRLVGEFALDKRVAVVTNTTLAPLYGEKTGGNAASGCTGDDA